jgi:hypothetical protein
MGGGPSKGGGESYEKAVFEAAKSGGYPVESIGAMGGSTHHSHKHHSLNTNDLSTLKDYEHSYASKAKDETIRKMARAMKKVGMNVNPDDDLDKIINDLNREIPNPKKGKTFAAEAKTQEKVCRIVAGVLNDEFTPGAPEHEKFIDLSMSPIEICRAVGEYTHSFNQGVNTEFLAVIGSVKNALHSMNIMDQVMNELYQKIQNNIGKADSNILEREIKPLNEVYTRARHERDQKKMVLENLLNIHLEPASKALQEALREHGNDSSLIKKLGLKLGTADFANAIAAALSGFGSTAAIANRVHKALKTVGLSMSEYVNSHSFKEFQQKLDSIVDEGKLNDNDLIKFLNATNSLRDGFDYRTDQKFKDIVARGGRRNAMGGGKDGGRRVKYNLGDNLDEFSRDGAEKSYYRKKASSIMAKKELISKDFVVRLDRHYSELKEAMRDIAINLGKTIPLTSKTELLKDALSHLSDENMSSGENNATSEMTIEFIVSRGIDTIEARRRKEMYINKLKMLADICETITGMEAYRSTSSKFAKVKDIVSKIEKMLEYYSNITNNTKNSMSTVGVYDHNYADSISHPSTPQSSYENKDDDDDDDTSFAVGGASDYEYKEINIPQIAKTGLTLNEIINTFNYYYYIAGVRNNLKISSKEYGLYGEDYSEMLGNSIAKRLYDLDVKHKKDIKIINSKLNGDAWLNNNDPANKNEKIRDEAKKWVDSEYNIKIKFYKALQALDLYLKEFTPAITSNIEAVKEIKTMLDETQVIARWFNETTGDKLCNAFEQLPGYNVRNAPGGGGGGVVAPRFDMNEPNNDRHPTVPTNSHYYNDIEKKYLDGRTFPPNVQAGTNNGVSFGNPLYGISIIGGDKDIKKVDDLKNNVDESLDHFQALKNIVNTFIRIGNKFGQTDLSTKVFMSPSQIYRVLFTFLKHSALRMHIPSDMMGDADENDHLMLYTQNAIDIQKQQLEAFGGPGVPPYIKNAKLSGGKLTGAGSNENIMNQPNNTIAPFSVYFTGRANGIMDNTGSRGNNHYEIENKFFHAMLKAMAGKIMTVVGSYDMLEMAPPKHWITDTRMILGGKRKKKRGGGIEGTISSEDQLEIITEAMPLYFKLPRLIEFYKEILDPKGNLSPTNIAFLPDLDGLFTQLFLLIFRKTKAPENGDYSDMELHKMVEEINGIYRYYQKEKSDDIITAVINDIVLDVNRKYGLIKKDDYNTWVEMTRERDNSSIGNIKINTTNYSILPDEDEYEVNKFAPSDLYRGLSRDGEFKYEDGKYINEISGVERHVFSSDTVEIVDSSNGENPHLKLMKEFREKLDSYFKDSNIQNMSSYTILVHQAEHNVKNAKTNKEKISTVFQLIQGTGNLGLQHDKAILFHETIITGLNVLSGIYLMLKRYHDNIKDSDPLKLEKKLTDILYGLLCLATKEQDNQLSTNRFNNNGDDTSNKYSIDAPAWPGVATALNLLGTDIAHHFDEFSIDTPYYEDIICRALFTGQTNKKHITESEMLYLYNQDNINGPILRGAKILPYYQAIGAAGAPATDADKRAYADDLDNLYPMKQATVQTGAVINIQDDNHWYNYKLGNNTDQNDNIFKNSHPEYNILSTVATLLLFDPNGGISPNNRLFKIGNGANDFVLPSDIIDYNNFKNNKGILSPADLQSKFGNRASLHMATRNDVDLGPVDDVDKKNLLFMRLISRVGVNYQHIMENLLENMYSLIVDSNGLIDLTYFKVENNKTKMNLNFTKLQNVVNGIITDLKFYLEYFRPFLKKSVIDHYENIEIGGSIYNLERHFNKMFNPNTDMYDTARAQSTYFDVELLSNTTNDIFCNLTRDTFVSFSALKSLLKYNKTNMDNVPNYAQIRAVPLPAPVPLDVNATNLYNINIIMIADLDANNLLQPNMSIFGQLWEYANISDDDNNINYTTRFEWFGGTMSNLIYYDFSKKMDYNLSYAFSNIKSPSFTNTNEIIKIDEYNQNNTGYNDARFATPEYFYPHGHFKLRELLGDSTSAIRARDMYVINAAVPQKYALDNTPANVREIPNFKTKFRYTAISMYSHISTRPIDNNMNFEFDEYLQISAQRMSIVLDQHGYVSTNYPKCEHLDTYSYPTMPSSITKNTGYNMGICVKDPKRPSKDTEYKLNTLISKSQKTDNYKAAYSNLIQWPNSKNNENDYREYSRAMLYSSDCVAFNHNSLMFIFNQILSRFLSAFIDPSTGNKIYRNLVNGFVNGIATKVASQPETGFPDLYRAATHNLPSQSKVAGHNILENEPNKNPHSMIFQKVLGLRGDVKNDSIIFQSLAYILQRIGKDMERNSGAPLHLLSTLTDVPMYMKESYRANLPSFIKIFDYIIRKAEFFKNILQKTNIKLNRYSQCDFANFINSCTGLTDVRVNDVRYELNSYFVPAKYLLGLESRQSYINNNNRRNINFANNEMMHFRDYVQYLGSAQFLTVADNNIFNTYIQSSDIHKIINDNIDDLINIINKTIIIKTVKLIVINTILKHISDKLIAPVAAFPAGWDGNIIPVMTIDLWEGKYKYIFQKYCVEPMMEYSSMTNVTSRNNAPIAANISINNMIIETIEYIYINRTNIIPPGGLRPAVMLAANNIILANMDRLLAFLQVMPVANNTSPFANNYANFIHHYYDGGVGGPVANRICSAELANSQGGPAIPVAAHALFGVMANPLSFRFAAEYKENQLSPGEILCRTQHRLYNESDYWHLPAFSKDYDSIQPNRITKSNNVKISCTRGTRGYDLPLKKNNNSNIFPDAEYNYAFLKITDANARSVNGFISVDGLNEFTGKNESSDEVKAKLVSLLDSVISHTYSISGCADEVLKELGDTPVYFETYEGSIESYQLRNNNDQLMPLSLSLWFMNDNYSLAQSTDIGPSHILFGGHNLGSSSFKLLYGTRQLLARDMALTYEDVPWVKTLLNRHNSSASDKQVEESRYLQFVNRLMNGLRFVVNSHGYKRIVAYNSSGIDNHDEFFGKHDGNIWKMDKRQGINGVQFVRRITDPIDRMNTILWHGNTIHLKNTVYALADGRFKKDLVIQLIEDSFQENSVSKMLMAFYVDENKPIGISRKDERIKVIIDSSIHPINIHALMQDIPLANVYNYEYTFETMAASMYGLLMKNISENEDVNMGTKHPLKQTIFEFLRLLRNPFAPVNPTAFHLGFNHEEPLFNIFIGDGSLGMGRPKFLSDQLFNKCLLNNVYYDNTMPKIKGPSRTPSEIIQLGYVNHARCISAYFNDVMLSQATLLIFGPFIVGAAPLGNVGINNLVNDIHLKAIEYANKNNGGPGAINSSTNPANYPDSTNTDQLFKFLLNAEDPNTKKTKSSPDLALSIGVAPAGGNIDNCVYATPWSHGPMGINPIVVARHPRVVNGNINQGYPGAPPPGIAGNIAHESYTIGICAFKVLSDRQLATRYRELYKKTTFYTKFMNLVKKGTMINILAELSINNSNFIKFAKLEDKLQKALDCIFEQLLLTAIITGTVVPPQLDVASTIPNAGLAFLNMPYAVFPIGNNTTPNRNWYGVLKFDDNMPFLAILGGKLISIGLFYDFNTPSGTLTLPPAGPTGLELLAIEFNRRYRNINNPGPASTLLIMSYLKEYNYRGKFDINAYTANDSNSNPLVKFEYSSNAGNPLATEGTILLRETIRNISYLRFNTNIIRNLFFISNILRIVRLQINREFTQNRNILKSSHFAISPSVTEYGMMDPNEISSSKYRDAGTYNDGIEDYSNNLMEEVE